MTKNSLLLAGAVLAHVAPAHAQITDKGNPYEGIDVSNETLVAELDSFESGFAQVNGIRMHYVEGGEGTPVVLMAGWPQTWWAFNQIMPDLAGNHHVIAVDIRGMGATDKPEGGYDKKNMARDIHELIGSLGYESAHIVGHDIGSQVAYAFAANYPDATTSVSFLDVSAQPQSTRDMRLVPARALTGNFQEDFFLWWFAFNQVLGMPEQLIEGRAHIFQNWFWDALLYKKDALSERDRAVYANAYNTVDGIRGGNGWYQAYAQDLDDQLTYPDQLTMPSLGIGGLGNALLVEFMTDRFAEPRLEHLPEAGHYIAEEAPEEVVTFLTEFLQSVDRQ
ncbi:alpha/beta hydrolase [Fertoebacter nigrum]|uniref:Alpha/beta hydrolase n=1 Tax=Fertoeibacter niger TaxID=2656921 RepID=A0A8X8H682_9RHOB|nr:alpha/beta hydrolase [Fertoeibacter niger]NUB46463.1 alpha/beta hydrolase [Fertoeibacter niger]